MGGAATRREAVAPRGRARLQQQSRGGSSQVGKQTRRRIIEAAIEFFGEVGIDHASTRAIAHRAQVSLPALQYYFGGKKGLHQACAERIISEIRAALDPQARRAYRALAQRNLGRSELLQLLKSIIDPLIENMATSGPQSWALFLARAYDEKWSALDAALETMSVNLIMLCARIIGRVRELPSDSPEITAHAMCILSQAVVVNRLQPLMLRTLGWSDFRGARLAILKDVLWQGVENGLRLGARGELFSPLYESPQQRQGDREELLSSRRNKPDPRPG